MSANDNTKYNLYVKMKNLREEDELNNTSNRENFNTNDGIAKQIGDSIGREISDSISKQISDAIDRERRYEMDKAMEVEYQQWFYKTFGETVEHYESNKKQEENSFFLIPTPSACICSSTLRTQIKIISKNSHKENCIWKEIQSSVKNVTNFSIIKIWTFLDKPFEKFFMSLLYRSVILRSFITGKKIDLNIPDQIYAFMEQQVSEIILILKLCQTNDVKDLHNNFNDYYEKIFNSFFSKFKGKKEFYFRHINPLYNYNFSYMLKDFKIIPQMRRCCNHDLHIIFVPILYNIFYLIPTLKTI